VTWCDKCDAWNHVSTSFASLSIERKKVQSRFPIPWISFKTCSGHYTLCKISFTIVDLLISDYRPTELCASPENDSAFLGRLLNIVLLANKYCIVSYEAWALDQILTIAQNPNSCLDQASPELCAHALHVASLCDHFYLMDIIIWRLVNADAVVGSELTAHIVHHHQARNSYSSGHRVLQGPRWPWIKIRKAEDFFCHWFLTKKNACSCFQPPNLSSASGIAYALSCQPSRSIIEFANVASEKP
jgi:hypothetical protein